jgi:hypothetical protein
MCGVCWLAEESTVPQGELHSVMLSVIHLSTFAYWAVHSFWEAFCIRIFFGPGYSSSHPPPQPATPVVLRPKAVHGLLIFKVSTSHTTTHHGRKDSSGRAISSSQRPLSDNTQLSQQKRSVPTAGFEPAITAGERPQTYALGYGCVGTRTDTTQQSGPAPDKEIKINHFVGGGSGYTETNSTGVLSRNNSQMPGATQYVYYEPTVCPDTYYS